MGAFWAVTPTNMVDIGELLTRGNTSANKSTVWKTFEVFEHLWESFGPKVSPFGLTLTLHSFLKMAEIEK